MRTYNWRRLPPGTELSFYLDRGEAARRFVNVCGEIVNEEGRVVGMGEGPRYDDAYFETLYKIVSMPPQPTAPRPGETVKVPAGMTVSEFLSTIPPTQAKPGAWLASLTSAERKECAVSRGFFAYFPDATAIVARHSVRMNEKHNPGQPVHWARGKSTDQPDCEARHLIATSVDPDVKDADGAHEMVCKAWRAMADLQEWIERKHARGEKI